MPTQKKSRKPGKTRKCVCVVLHTYDAYVTADSWNVSVHSCVVCGIEHFQEIIPPSGEPTTEAAD